MRETSRVGRGLLVLALSLLLTARWPALAEQAPALCTITFDNGRLSPGLSMTPAPGNWSAGPGTIDCQGSLDGHQVTGPGTITEHGTLVGSCPQGTGSGTQLITIPTTAGNIHFEQAMTFQWLGTGGPFEGPRMSGTFEFTPTRGDCVTQPLTGYAQETQAVISDL